MLSRLNWAKIFDLLSAVLILVVMFMLLKIPGVLIFLGVWLLLGLVSMIRKKWEIRKLNKALRDFMF